MAGVVYWAFLIAVMAGYAVDPEAQRAVSVTLVAAIMPLAIFAFRAIRSWSQEEASALALRDDLTGMPNRAYFMDQLEKAMARVQRNKRHVAVLFIDLDRFKVFNDTMGHAAGDRLIIEVGKRLRRQVRAGETSARLGGDEFTVLLDGLTEIGEAEAAAQRISANLNGSVMMEGHEVFVSASIGIAFSPSSYVTPDELVRRADVALYQAKADGRACYRVFQPGKSAFTVERLEMDNDLRVAIERDELQLYYQPEVDLQSGDVVAFEALVRWRHASRGLLLPGEFLATAEEAGLIQSLGRWVLREACFEAAKWQSSAGASQPVTVSVNISPMEFRQRNLVSDVISVLGQTGLEPSRLRLEIVESALMVDTEATIETLNVLHELGVKLAIDDFGSGFSSLNYLRQFPVDTLKIDGKFLLEATHDERARAVIDCIVSLAHVLGMDVVGEGVETNDHLKCLIRSNCDRAQGYLFSRPIPSAALKPYVESRQAEQAERLTVAGSAA